MIHERYISLFADETDTESVLEKLEEAVRYHYVIRKGRKLKKPFSTRPGYRIVRGKKGSRPKLKRITASEHRKRSRKAKRGAKKAKGKRKSAARKRRRSMRKHTW